MARPPTPQIHSSAATALSLLLAILTIAPSGAQSRHSTAQVSSVTARTLSSATVLHSSLDEQQHDIQSGLPLLPGQEAEGIVTGIAGPEARAEFAAAEALKAVDGGRRALLHGNKRPQDYTLCPRCSLIECKTGANSCTGHCKTAHALFTCRTNMRVRTGCAPAVSVPDPRTLAPDPLLERRSVQVVTPAPFLGCANITGLADGCPDRGTTGTDAARGRVEVVTSWCVQRLYELICVDRVGPLQTPFYPFGHCRCLMRDESGRVFGGPCRTSYLNWTGPDVVPEEVPVRVSTEGGSTFTRFSQADDVDEITFSMNHTIPSEEGPITSELTVFFAEEADGIDIVREGPLPGVDGVAEEPGGGESVEEGGPDDGAAGAAEGADEEEQEDDSEEEQEEEEEEENSAWGKFSRGFKWS